MSYSTFKEACTKLNSLNPIEYFFAQQVMAYIKSYNKLSSKDDEIQLFHILMQLQASYNAGNSCLPLSKIADKKKWSESTFEDNLDSEEEQQMPKNGYTFSSIDKITKIITSLNLSKHPAINYQYGCLYINRMWLFENEIAANIKKRVSNLDTSLDKPKLKAQMQLLFTANKSDETDWQQVAVAKSLLHNFSIISGGPGTGKTTTVAKIILALQHMNADNKLNIQLVAPTGKAAQRLKESIANSKNFIPNEQLDLSVLPTEAKTLHRFLGLSPNTTYIKYNNENKSPCDVLIIDEASMVDINMFIYILRAIKDDCKLILLGDVDQLPSVETGNILAQFAMACGVNEYSNEVSKFIKEITGYEIPVSQGQYDFITFLQKSYRTKSADILTLAKNVISSNKKTVQSVGKVIDYKNLSDIDYDKYIEEFIKNIAIPYFKRIAAAKSAQEALNQLKKFRVLVANRNINIGTVRLNEIVEKYLGKKSNTNYNGRPIMVVENNYSTHLFNGDVGIIWDEVAYFEDTEDKLTPISLVRLPKVETVYVMTIHKTQGSEFDNVAIILPEKHNRVLNRNLLYTGITRAKSKVYVRTTKKVWDETVQTSVARDSNIYRILLDNKNNIGAV